MLSISSWNIDPNRVWFVRLADNGANIAVELYLNKANAQAQANRQAHGNTSGFGSNLPVTLANDPGAAYPVSLFQPAYPWHLRVSGSDADPAKIYRIKEFVDLEEISHPVFRNAALITTRASAEIDAHTHARIAKEIELGSHLPTLEPGDTVRLNSTRRGKDEILQAIEHRIQGEINEGGEARLTSTLTVAAYIALRR
jgi:hypothetical protein